MADIPRRAALNVLLAEGSARMDDLISAQCSRYGLSGRDRAFAAELCHGAGRHRRALDYLISLGAGRATDKMDKPVLAILRMGLYQAAGMEGARHAAVNEAVELAKSGKTTRRAAGFVNAALRGILRLLDAEGLAEAPIHQAVGRLVAKTDLPFHVKLGIQYSFPDWWAARWNRQFGADLAGEIMARCQSKSPAFIRPNLAKFTAAEVERRLAGGGIVVEPFELADGLFRIADGVLPPDSPLISEGVVQPQDGASFLAATLLEPSAGSLVADVCCGKGIKTGYFASRAGRVICFDANARSLAALKKNMARQGFENAFPVLADMSAQWPVKRKFSAIFLDAPCSGSGLAKRHPEGKWSKSEELISKMSQLQERMLGRAADALAAGGRLVYAICSVEPEEGPANVEKLLARDRSLRIIPPAEVNPRLSEYSTSSGGLLITPGTLGMDGFFVAALERAG